MEEKSPENPQETDRVQNPDRRKLLKLLAAGGAVTAVSMLPGKWSSPVVKTGVLPAHAQVTPTPTVYEVRCGSWTWEFFEDEVSFYEFTGTATAFNLTDNVPVAGVRINASALVAPATFRTGFGDTDANGVATIVITVDVPDLQVGVVDITVSFNDQAQYGDDTCTAQIIFQQPA